jgi:hypothetical protein
MLTPFVRTPRLHPAPPGAVDNCPWDPWAALDLPSEDLTVLLTAAAADSAAGGAGAGPRVGPAGGGGGKARSAQVRAAYLDIAAEYHPDNAVAGSGGDASLPSPWRRGVFNSVHPRDVFAAASLAYRLLMDPVAAAEWLSKGGLVVSAQYATFAPAVDHGAASAATAAPRYRPHVPTASEGEDPSPAVAGRDTFPARTTGTGSGSGGSGGEGRGGGTRQLHHRGHTASAPPTSAAFSEVAAAAAAEVRPLWPVAWPGGVGRRA